MAKRTNPAQIEAWTLDQLAKSTFFHRKLHEWKLVEVSDQIDAVRGEELSWDNLNISAQAWNKIIHRGIKPVLVFAHPQVLQVVPGAVGYYRMLAMVSQKSMKRVGINLDSYELGKSIGTAETAWTIAHHLNRIISVLVEADETVNAREFDLWRGMAAGSQAQGSWQNNKGAAAEVLIREAILRRLQDREIVVGEEASSTRLDLGDGRTLIFADEPDIAIYEGHLPLIAIEVKGGIDPAGVLERIGAAIKSLQRTRAENPQSVTILIVQGVSMTERARQDLTLSAATVTHLFSVKSIVEDESDRERFFGILGL